MQLHTQQRQARLLPDAGLLYPAIAADTWIQADEMADSVRCLRLLHGQSSARWGERPLNPKHFEFRHGPTVPEATTRPPRRRSSDGLGMIEVASHDSSLPGIWPVALNARRILLWVLVVDEYLVLLALMSLR